MSTSITDSQARFALTRLHALLVPEDNAALCSIEAPSPAAIANGPQNPSPDALRKALTADATLEAYAYRLDAESILKLARLYDAGSTLDLRTVMECLGFEITATPMYPDFPSQVMSMDEAEYRLHQSIHYLSTYGVESLSLILFDTAIDVQEGWRPEAPETAKTAEQNKLLEAQVVQLCIG